MDASSALTNFMGASFHPPGAQNSWLGSLQSLPSECSCVPCSNVEDNSSSVLWSLWDGHLWYKSWVLGSESRSKRSIFERMASNWVMLILNVNPISGLWVVCGTAAIQVKTWKCCHDDWIDLLGFSEDWTLFDGTVDSGLVSSKVERWASPESRLLLSLQLYGPTDLLEFFPAAYLLSSKHNYC